MFIFHCVIWLVVQTVRVLVLALHNLGVIESLIIIGIWDSSVENENNEQEEINDDNFPVPNINDWKFVENDEENDRPVNIEFLGSPGLSSFFDCPNDVEENIEYRQMPPVNRINHQPFRIPPMSCLQWGRNKEKICFYWSGMPWKSRSLYVDPCFSMYHNVNLWKYLNYLSIFVNKEITIWNYAILIRYITPGCINLEENNRFLEVCL